MPSQLARGAAAFVQVGVNPVDLVGLLVEVQYHDFDVPEHARQLTPGVEVPSVDALLQYHTLELPVLPRKRQDGP